MPTLSDDFERTCRYGHGPLSKLDSDENGPFDALVMIAIDASTAPYTLLSRGLTLTAWGCPTCSYTELFEFKKP